MTKSFQWKTRYSVLLILCLGSIVSYMDRVIMTVAAPYISKDLHLTPLQAGVMISVFSATYAIAQVPGGFLADRFGVRKVSATALVWWSSFTALTGAAMNFPQMVAARLLFGIGEGVFPACLFKSIPVWFPKKERATANAIRLASSPVGASIAPIMVVSVMSIWGWRAAFWVMLIPGVIVAILFWFLIPDRPAQSKRVSPEELAEIEGDDAAEATPDAAKPSPLRAFREPYVFKYFLILHTIDIAYWGFTSWFPSYLVNARGFSMQNMGLAATVPFLSGIVGSILGGWASERFFSANRRLPLITAQILSAVFLYGLYSTQSTTVLFLCMTLAGLCLNFSITSFWALPMNTVPKQLMGVASGFINMGGQLAAFVSPIVIGYLVGASAGSFDNAFLFLISSLVVASLIVVTLPRRSDARAVPVAA